MSTDEEIVAGALRKWETGEYGEAGDLNAYRPEAAAVLAALGVARRHPSEIDFLSAQIEELALVIMEEFPGESSEDEDAVDTAIRLLRARGRALDTLAALLPWVANGSSTDPLIAAARALLDDLRP